MRTILQERCIHNGHNNLTSHGRPKTKPTRNASRDRRSTNTPVHSQIPEKEGNLAMDNGLQIRGRRTRLEQTSITITATAFNPREFNTKPKSQVFLEGPRERLFRKKPQCSGGRGVNDGKDVGGLSSSPLPPLMSDAPPGQEPAEALLQSDDSGRTRVLIGGDTDDCSGLSDMESLPGTSATTSPPHLHLRPEALNRCDPLTLTPLSQGQRHPCNSYPDFLPPPFNSWSLQQLAVYLNTDGRSASRPRPSGQLERYLERLLQLEWHQIQTVQEESSMPAASMCGGIHRPQGVSHCSLSAPKSILHCPRAFPLALLSSLAQASPSCSCLSCRNPHHEGDPTCRSHVHPQCSHSRLLLEGRGRAATASRRSSSEPRSRQAAPRPHRLSDPLDSSCHLMRMLASGNIRNPAASPCSGQYVSSVMSLEAGPLRGRGPIEGEGRSRSCGDVKEGYRQTRTGHTAHKSSKQIRQSSKSPGATSSGELQSSTESDIRRPAGKQKRVEFIIT